MTPQTSAPPHGLLPDALSLGVASLTVSDLTRAVAFYEEAVGLRLLDREGATAALGGEGGSAVISLTEVAGARPKPRSAAGLFHVAILLPDRRDLAFAFARLSRAGLLTGAADHLVSEAIYLDDPDGNGIEIYRDRPRAEWPHRDGRVTMANAPLEADELNALVFPHEALDAPAPAGTRLGHVHLQVGDLDAARAFWIDAVGFALTTSFPGALFMSAGGYHHHLAANVWSSRGAAPAPEGGAGLREFEVVLPTEQDLESVAARLAASGRPVERTAEGVRAADPWGSTAVFRTKPS